MHLSSAVEVEKWVKVSLSVPPFSNWTVRKILVTMQLARVMSVCATVGIEAEHAGARRSSQMVDMKKIDESSLICNDEKGVAKENLEGVFWRQERECLLFLNCELFREVEKNKVLVRRRARRILP